jgi:predicted transcriptional regulator
MTTHEIAEALSIGKSSTQLSISKLMRRGWIERKRSLNPLRPDHSCFFYSIVGGPLKERIIEEGVRQLL